MKSLAQKQNTFDVIPGSEAKPSVNGDPAQYTSRSDAKFFQTFACARVTEREEAWVVFIGEAELFWQKFLRPGFRHCCILLNDGERWISFDPMSNYTDIHVHKLPVEFNLPLWLQDNGHRVVRTTIARTKKEAPWMPYSCVEAVKRVLGIHERWIITPWQLYRYLLKTNPSTKGE